MIINTLFEKLEKSKESRWYKYMVSPEPTGNNRSDIVIYPGEIDNVYEFSTFISDIFLNLQLSILSGEYLEDQSFNQNLINLRSKSDELIFDLNFEKKTFRNTIYSALLRFNSELSKNISYFSYLLNRVKKRYSIYDHSHLDISNIIKEENAEKGSILRKIQGNSLYFSLLVNLEIYDHELVVNEEMLSNLILIKEEIEQSRIISEVVQVLSKSKCTFLIQKILYGLKGDKNSYTYSFKFEDKVLLFDNYTDDYFSEFDKKLKLIYADDLNLDTKKTWLEASEIQSNPSTFYDFQLLVKYYKDKIQSHNGIKNLITKFKEKFKDLSNDANVFNKRAYHVALHYLENNELSFVAERNILKHEEVEKILDTIRENQKSSLVNNYFSYLVYSKYLIRQIKNELNKEGIDISKCKTLLSKLDLELVQLFKNYEWCLDRNFFAFRTGINECQESAEIQGESYKLFIASSFINPINFKKVLNEIEEIQRISDQIKYKIESRELFEKREQILNQRMEENVTRVKNSEIRNIEILSIFSAIVLFVAGNITNSQIESRERATFMFLFGGALSLFVLLIWLLIDDKQKWSIKTTIVVIAISLMVLSSSIKILIF